MSARATHTAPGGNRRDLHRRKIPHTTIPEPKDQRAGRRHDSADGRPTGFDAQRYNKRNIAERAINRLKNFRAVTTRYDRRACIYLGTITVATLTLRLRTWSGKQDPALVVLGLPTGGNRR